MNPDSYDSFPTNAIQIVETLWCNFLVSTGISLLQCVNVHFQSRPSARDQALLSHVAHNGYPAFQSGHVPLENSPWDTESMSIIAYRLTAAKESQPS